MSIIPRRRLPACVLVLSGALSSVLPVAAAPSTAQGRLSVAQVQQMLDGAPVDRVAQQVLVAYLAGVGETAGVVVDMSRAVCRQPLSLSSSDVREAIDTAARRDDRAEVPATPLIVRDMLRRAGCQKA
ncbi:chlorophyllide reductase subunit BchY [Azorhizobium oxalatiphilum]|uniref:Chlorophyllide reductase subunit BchY n=1 Tax=Azorhizobium oxalatiphilum TaxID=980631 RepID=A0A917BKB8_9HYPH|nr:chlorophyllide reductase [Azorhizobium oxalatiphilum]GGF45241.1 chlorophyllide reductase subunit BchY [Azorhizobium oxalatiphilum]